MTMPTRSPPTRRGRSAGPTGSSTRRLARGRAARRRSRGRRRPRRSGATAGSTSSTSTATGRSPTEELGAARRRARARRRPVGGRGRRARGHGRRARRPGRAPRARSRARGQGRARVRHRHVRRRRGRASSLGSRVDASPRTRSRCCTTRSSPAARSCTCPPASWSSEPIVVLHWSEGDGARVVPAHARRRSASDAEARCSTASARRETDHLVDAVDRARSSATTRTCGTSRCRSTARAPGTSRSSARTSAATRRCASSAVALGGDYARLRSESLLAGQGAESDLLAVYFGDGDADARLPHAAGPRRAATRAATCCSRARSRTPPARCTPGSSASGTTRAEVERVPDQPQPRAHRGRERGVDPEPRDRGQRREVLARVDGRPDRRRPALLPRDAAASRPRRPSGSSCSGSSTTCSTGCRSRALARAAARARWSRSSSTAGSATMGDARARVRASTTSRPARRGASTSTAIGSRVVRIGDDFYVIGDECSHADYSLVRGRRVGGRARDRVPEARLDVLARRPASRRRLPATQPGAGLRRRASTATT